MPKNREAILNFKPGNSSLQPAPNVSIFIAGVVAMDKFLDE
jgi:hypothetical protein